MVLTGTAYEQSGSRKRDFGRLRGLGGRQKTGGQESLFPISPTPMKSNIMDTNSSITGMNNGVDNRQFNRELSITNLKLKSSNSGKFSRVPSHWKIISRDLSKSNRIMGFGSILSTAGRENTVTSTSITSQIFNNDCFLNSSVISIFILSLVTTMFLANVLSSIK